MKFNFPDRSKSNDWLSDNSSEDFGEGVWQISFLDIITVMLCMMIILASIPTKGLLPNFRKGGVDQLEEGEYPSTVDWGIFRLNEELTNQLSNEIKSGKLLLEKGEYEIRMIFTGSSFYEQGSAVLLPEGKEIILGIVEKLVTWNRQDYKIDVEGHTDSAPIQNFQFPSNWELSTARASGVVKFFLISGIPPQKLKASGFADAMPLYPEVDSNGNLLVKNRDYNRRIVIRLYFE